MEETPDTRIDDCNEASKTYHTRFKRLCEEKAAATTELNAGINKWENQLPLEFVAEFSPLLARFGILYIEFGECMELIGENHVKACDVFLEGIEKRDEIIKQAQEEIEQIKKKLFIF